MQDCGVSVALFPRVNEYLSFSPHYSVRSTYLRQVGRVGRGQASGTARKPGVMGEFCAAFFRAHLLPGRQTQDARATRLRGSFV
jgi:hypothetical protein